MRCEAAAGDSQVVRVPLTAQQVHVGVPQLQVSVSAASHKHLTTRWEAAGHHTGLTDLDAPVDDVITALTISTNKCTHTLISMHTYNKYTYKFTREYVYLGAHFEVCIQVYNLILFVYVFITGQQMHLWIHLSVYSRSTLIYVFYLVILSVARLLLQCLHNCFWPIYVTINCS